MQAYFDALFLSWLNSHLPCALLLVGSQLTYHPSAILTAGLYTDLSHEAMRASILGLVFLSLCDTEHRPDSWNFRNIYPLRERVD